MSNIRKSTGGVVERKTSCGISYHVRFRVGGKRQSVYVGRSADGTTRADADRALAYELERVNRGEWAPPVVQELREVPSFREAASDWLAARKIEGGRNGKGLSAASVADLEWRLGHLLREFASTPLDRIDVAAVDAYRRRLARQGKLGSRSINRTLEALASVIEEALEQGVIVGRNPALGKRRRLPVGRPRRTYIDRAEQIEALFDAAGQLDRERVGSYRRALLAVLVLGGLRIGELLDLRWADVHLGSGRLHVRGGKTDAAERSVNLLPLLRDELAALAASRPSDDPDAFVFATATGKPHSRSNVRSRVLAPAVEKANEALAKRNAEPLSDGLTPHSLRRTFASVLYALGEAPPYVMAQMGHTSPNLALAIYAKAMDRRDGEPDRLAALIGRPHRVTTGNESVQGNEESTVVGSIAA